MIRKRIINSLYAGACFLFCTGFVTVWDNKEDIAVMSRDVNNNISAITNVISKIDNTYTNIDNMQVHLYAIDKTLDALTSSSKHTELMLTCSIKNQTNSEDPARAILDCISQSQG